MSNSSKAANQQADLASDSYRDRWAAVPTNGKQCVHCGLGHSAMYRLLNGLAKPYVRTANLREPGRNRGKLLFHVGDLLSFFDSISTQGIPKTDSEAGEKLSRSEDTPD